MKHPFEILRPEYTQLLGLMTIRPEKREAVDHMAVRILGVKSRLQQVTDANGVPIAFIGPSVMREDNLDFTRNPAQGAPLNRISSIIPHNGPFRTWFDAAIAAYHLNGLDKVGAANWTWEKICFYGELFNGFGPRDYHHQHTSYLWGGTNIQTVGKYTSDGHYDATHWDEQLGMMPVARRMAEIDPTVALAPLPIPEPVHSGLSDPESGGDTKFVQDSLNRLGWMPPLKVDGSYGDKTKKAVEHFQRNFGLKVDFAGPQTVKALRDALAAIEADAKETVQ